MADDQTPKTMEINELVRELSKSSMNPVTSPMPTDRQAPEPQATRPLFPIQKPTTPPSMTGSLSVPSVPKPPTPVVSNPISPVNPLPPAGKSAPTSPLPTPGVKEYQSSIRTMSEDIAKIKQGQQPTGVPIPRKIEPVAPVSTMTPPPLVKPTVPTQQFKVPSVNLSETQKTGPLAQLKDFSKPAQVSPRPVPTVPKAEPTKPQIYVPEGEQKIGNRKMLFVGIGAGVVVAGFALWFFVLRPKTPQVVVETPTPSATPTETLATTSTPTLTSIFSGSQKQTVTIQSQNPISSFVSDVMGKVIEPGLFRIMEVSDFQTPAVLYGFADLVTKLALKMPSELVSNFGDDSAMFVYGQKESFNSKGNLQVGVKAPNKIVIVAELKNAFDVLQMTAKWESTMSSDLKALFSLGNANKNQPGFVDNSYRNTAVRYKNFPYADKSIDYAIVSALNGKSYLVISDSRESIFTTIDKLVNF